MTTPFFAEYNVWVIGAFAVCLLVPVLWGLRYRRRIEKVDDYAVAGRRAAPLPIILSVAAASLGASGLLTLTGEVYEAGLSRIWGSVAGLVVLALAHLLLLPAIRRAGEQFHTRTIGDVMALRFGGAARLPAALVIFVAYGLLTALQLVVFGRIVELMFGIPQWVGVIALFACILLKSVYGGMLAVMRSHVWQGLWQSAGLALLFLVLFIAGGGVGGILGGITANNLPDDFLSLALPGKREILTLLLSVGAFQLLRQDQWQRVWSARTNRISKLAMGGGALVYAGSLLLCVGIAVTARTTLTLPAFTPPDNALFVIAREALPFGAALFVLTAVIATILSCADNYLLTAASNLSCDLMLPLLFESDERRRVRWCRLGTTITSLLALAAALLLPNLLDWWSQAVAALCVTLLPSVFAAFYWKRATNAGALASMWGGLLTFILWQLLRLEGITGLPPIYAGLVASVGLMLLVSLVTKHRDRDAAARLFFWQPRVAIADEYEESDEPTGDPAPDDAVPIDTLPEQST